MRYRKDFHKRKNWIHLGSKEAGPRVAAIISIVETCRRLSLPVRDYLGSVLPGLADFPINRVAELTPTAWAVRKEGNVLALSGVSTNRRRVSSQLFTGFRFELCGSPLRLMNNLRITYKDAYYWVLSQLPLCSPRWG
jgi:hypothetical protein